MTDYAIIETGSKQYRVEPKSLIDVELLPLAPDQKEVFLERVLLVRSGEDLHIGTPVVPGAKVVCDLVGEIRAKKVVSFKFKNRKNFKKKIGHRQDLMRLLVKEIKLN